METEVFCDSASKISDDSGIEDMNEDGFVTKSNTDNQFSSMRNPKSNVRKSTEATVSTENLDCCDEIDSKEDMMLPCIYPLPENEMPLAITYLQDIKDPNGLPGICGIQNLGNTCFINAGIQCLFRSLQQFLMCQNDENRRKEKLFEGEAIEALFNFEEKLRHLIKQISSGMYSAICPQDFYKALASIHYAFGDRKQHDCQEFISFLLNALHEAYSMSVKSVFTDEVYCDNYQVEDHKQQQGVAEDKKRMKMDSVYIEDPDVGVVCEEGITDAEKSWRIYTKQNDSYIVDTFHGQFKSVVTCGKCRHISVTYEPFVCMSLPIPYALEKQFAIIWLPSPKYDSSAGKIRTRRLLVTVKKYGHVKDIKIGLMKILQANEDSEIRNEDVILAQVKKSAVVRTLDERMQIRYLDSSDTDIYAIEICPVEDKSLGFHARNLQTEERSSESENEMEKTGKSLPLKESEKGSFHWNGKHVVSEEQREEKEQQSSTEEDNDQNQHTTLRKREDISPSSKPYVDIRDEDQISSGSFNSPSSGWHSCSICLEDTFDSELTIHTKCGGILCYGCLETTNLYHGNKSFPCPVCRTIVISADYEPFVKLARKMFLVRNITVPLLVRYPTQPTQSDGRKKLFMTIGHPVLLMVPSQVNATLLYEKAEIVLQQYGNVPDFTLVLTDAQGQNCVRCEPLTRCSGCTLERDTVLCLRPGDHFTVHLPTVSDEFLNQVSLTLDDPSMQKSRESDVVQLDECFERFCASESLDEGNTWFCPQCRVDQVATKVMAISRLPRVALVHLKRFYFEGTISRKVETPISFPLDDLNLKKYSTSENDGKDDIVYELVSCVCHTGDLLTGHYTSFAKQKETGKWYYFNDEVLTEKSPSSSDFENVYVLCYERKAPQAPKCGAANNEQERS